MPKILMVAPLCYPVAAAESIVNAKLFMALTRAGYDVDVLSHVPEKTIYSSDNNRAWNVLKNNVTCLDCSRGWSLAHLIELLLVKTRTGHCYRGASWAGKALNVADRYHKQKNYDFVLSRSQPSEIIGMYMARKHGLKWIANWNDPYPVEKYPSPYGFGAECALSRNKNRLLKSIVSFASWHIFPSMRLREYMLSYFPESEQVFSRSSVIPHISCKHILSKDVAYPKINRNNDEFVLIHTGKLVFPRLPRKFLEGYRMFLDQTKAKSRVVFVGKIDESLITMAIELGLQKNIDVLGSMSYSSCLNVIKQGDVALLMEANCSEGIFLPSKFVDYIQCGKPVICVSPKNGTINDMISVYGGGVVADAASAEDVCEKIKLIYDDFVYKVGKDHGTERLHEQFSEECVLGCYEEIFRSVLI